MAYIIQPLLVPQQLANAAAVLYTSTSARTQIQQFTLVNPSLTTGYWAKVWWVPAGQSPADAYLVLPQTVIFPGATLIVTALVGQTLGYGDAIYADAETAAKINVAASGLVMSP